MADDPYDFEIAIPAASTNASRSTRHHGSSSGSDENVSDSGGSLSNMSSFSSDGDSSPGSDQERQHRTKSGFEKAVKSTIEPKTAVPLSALDRGKFFLSKYSSEVNRTKVPFSSSSRRVSLDSDNEDFSMESSSSGNEKNDTNTNRSTSNTTITGDNNPSHSFKQQTVVAQVTDTQERDLSASDEEAESSQNSDHPPPYTSNYTLPTTVTRHEDGNSDRSEVGDSIESYHSGGSEERSEKLTMETPRRTLAKGSSQSQNEDYEESFQEESLSQDTVMNQMQSTSGITSVGPQQSVVSESEAYDEERFDEDSTAIAAQSSSIQPAVNTENVFDYSMDFSDDDNEGPQLEVHIPQLLSINNPVREDSMEREPESRSMSSRSGSDRVNEEQSAFLESTSFREGEDDARQPVLMESHAEMSAANRLPGVVHTRQLPDLFVNDNDLRQEPTSTPQVSSSSTTDITDNRFSLDTGTSQVLLAPPQRIPSQQQSDNVAKETPVAKRTHVEIVRAYQFEEDKRVEMKDASTQFTGNHAAIQTDLVPVGMHNLFVASSTTPIMSRNGDSSRSHSFDSPQQQPPPPPISPMLGTTAYSLDALKLPIATSTSLYRQQLLALQEQILQKKRETERIVQDRMAFQYSSLRGTERFIAARRAQKMELWEALMRVDPTLDERKARETARLAQAAST